MLRTSTDAILESEVLLCPACGCECVHPMKVKVATSSKVVVIERKRVQVIEAETAETREAKQERGVRITLEYHCENGHHGNLILQFHKGNTVVLHEDLPPEREAETLWRS
ncbi:hypothetical protein JXA31_09715 [Candidatus Bathyarchaeota archaeon]|nr:hypothetical protein [Candidatus Bathyarchaeota archaeon]